MTDQEKTNHEYAEARIEAEALMDGIRAHIARVHASDRITPRELQEINAALNGLRSARRWIGGGGPS